MVDFLFSFFFFNLHWLGNGMVQGGKKAEPLWQGGRTGGNLKGADCSNSCGETYTGPSVWYAKPFGKLSQQWNYQVAYATVLPLRDKMEPNYDKVSCFSMCSCLYG